MTLESHSDDVYAVAITSDNGKIVSEVFIQGALSKCEANLTNLTFRTYIDD
jgi:hypothetical protein